MTRGRFITLEGGEGVGKSTLAHGLVTALRARGLDAVQTREPGGSEGADAIRALLVQGGVDRWSSTAEALLFAAARSDHLDRLIRPSLDRGAWVVCDRYIDSTHAYQVVAGGLPHSTFLELHKIIRAPSPDLTIILDLDPAIGLARSRGGAVGEDRFEQKDLAFHQRARADFLRTARTQPRRCVVIDASRPKDAALAEALKVIDDRLK